ncbi:TPA: hypothetical protein HA278_07715 [Candidatus Woesearchaeota archaeon]|nr:hypothetical protein [Candidatus Woesearchaeota archaeon]|tara:strand:+ start:188 stop:682 length:495 start_codon:yes stop_codon:yes gene_type:complete
MDYGKPVTYHPKVAELLGGIKEAIFLQNLLYWQKRGKRKDGFIYKSHKDITKETGLTRHEQIRIRTKLITKGVLFEKVKRAGKFPTVHYYASEKNLGKLQEKTVEKYVDKPVDKRIPLYGKRTNHDCTENVQTITEITTKITNRREVDSVDKPKLVWTKVIPML